MPQRFPDSSASSNEPSPSANRGRIFQWLLISGRILVAMAFVYLIVWVFFPMSGKLLKPKATSTPVGNSPSVAPHLFDGEPGSWTFDRNAGISFEELSAADVQRSLEDLPKTTTLPAPASTRSRKRDFLRSLGASRDEQRVVRSGLWECVVIDYGEMKIATLSQRSAPYDSDSPDSESSLVEVRVAVPADDHFQLIRLPMTASVVASDPADDSHTSLMPLPAGVKVVGRRISRKTTETACLCEGGFHFRTALDYWRGKGWRCTRASDAVGEVYTCTRDPAAKDSERQRRSICSLPTPHGSLFLITLY